MAIVFHCQRCGKKIEAPANAGGKWGKCPACQNKVYVPLEKADDDMELRLAPLDDAEEGRRKQLFTETFELTQDILKEKTIPEGDDEPQAQPDDAPFVLPLPAMETQELSKEIVRYLRSVAHGDLDKAAGMIDTIVAYGPRSTAILDRIALSEIPEPQLANIPRPVLSALIRELRTQIQQSG